MKVIIKITMITSTTIVISHSITMTIMTTAAPVICRNRNQPNVCQCQPHPTNYVDRQEGDCLRKKAV